MKKNYNSFLSLILTVLVLIPLVSMMGVTVSAEVYSGACGDNLIWTLDTSTGVININGRGDMSDYTEISDTPWFSYRSYIKAVIVGNGVTSIGRNAFYGCGYIESVSFPESLVNIGADAFYSCSSLKSVAIPESVTAIGVGAFNYCKSLEGVYITDLEAWCKISFSYITSNPLFYAKKLYINGVLATDIVIPETVTYITAYLFNGCESLKSVSIPDSVTDIESYAFYRCRSLASINVPDTVTSIAGYVFSDTAYFNNAGNWENGLLYIDRHLIMADKNVKSSCSIKEGTLVIAAKAFEYRDEITSMNIPNSVKSIGANAFYYCQSLKSVSIPDTVTAIEEYSFYCCNSLSTVDIPDTITSIGEYAFYSCVSLDNVTLPDSPISIGSSAFKDTLYYKDISNWENNVLYIGKHLICAKTSLKGLYSVKEGTLTIAAYGFSSCGNFTSITIPSSVKIIGDFAFSGCVSLNSVKITDIESWCGIIFGNNNANPLCYAKNLFVNSVLLITLNIPDSVTSVGSHSFYNCNSITRINIPDSVTSIGDSAFESCIRLTSINIPDSVTSIGDKAFANCTVLKSAVVGNSVPELNYTFDQCGALTEITIGNNVKVINGALRDCNSLVSVVLPDSVTTIGASTFENCTLLRTVTIPESVTFIGNHAFHYNENNTYQKLTLITLRCYKDSYAHTYAIDYGYKRELISKNHSFTNYVSDNNATCVTDGTKTAYCDCGCGATDTVIEENTMLGHLFTNYISNGNATCGRDGTKSANCNRGCGAVDTVIDEGSKNYIEHNYQISIIREASCSQSGLMMYKCEVCFEYYTEEIPAVEHIFTNYIFDNNATCIDNGTKTAYCDRGCGSVNTVKNTDIVPENKPHDYTETIIEAPTCLVKGSKIYICSLCRDFYIEDVDTFAHEGKWVINKMPTIKEEGEKSFICIVCGKVIETKVISKLVPSIYFPDVPKTGQWYSEGVYYCVTMGYLTGTDKGTYDPHSKLTREQFAVILARVAGEDLSKYTETKFIDVKANEWYGSCVIWANENGYINGIDDGSKFGVGQDISREQIATIFFRYAKKNGVDVFAKSDLEVFMDADSVSPWAKEACQWAVDAGLLYSTKSDTMILAPKMSVTRAQAAKIFMSYDKMK
ncbi:MAG: leucine-rich repeat protein [Clostridia bacterium]|nr:leucine-rich repeat protein [Clostridia bacterium]